MLASLAARAISLAARALPTIITELTNSLLSGGLFLGRCIIDGAGLLMGKNSPFKNIPVLGWIL